MNTITTLIQWAIPNWHFAVMLSLDLKTLASDIRYGKIVRR
ncbi:MAG: hypothetical protein ACK44E_12455 [Anaerolineales bacterium]